MGTLHRMGGGGGGAEQKRVTGALIWNRNVYKKKCTSRRRAFQNRCAYWNRSAHKTGVLIRIGTLKPLLLCPYNTSMVATKLICKASNAIL